MKKIALTTLAALASMAPGLASAQSFDGTTLNFQYYFPDSGSPYFDADNGPFVVGPGVEVTNIASVGTMDLSGSNILVDFTQSTSWTPASFNGWILSDLTNNLNSITGVSINPSTNMSGFSLANLSWTADSITTNWQGLAFTSDTFVSLDVSFDGVNNAVPEPGTWATLLLGFGFIGGAMRSGKRRKKLTNSYA